MQRWAMRGWDLVGDPNGEKYNPVRAAYCDHCTRTSIWVEDVMLYPDTGRAPQPNPDLPGSVKSVYLEAASISTKSPRGAAALLRLALQLLCAELGEGGKDINKDIGELVRKGLPESVQQALDIVRVTGNNAVHPGQIDFDDSEVVQQLFVLLNMIAEYRISLPSQITRLYQSLPQVSRDQIQKRDGPTTAIK